MYIIYIFTYKWYIYIEYIYICIYIYIYIYIYFIDNACGKILMVLDQEVFGNGVR